MKNVRDKYGNTPLHYIGPETPVTALNALKEIKITDKPIVCVKVVCEGFGWLYEIELGCVWLSCFLGWWPGVCDTYVYDGWGMCPNCQVPLGDS